jgi:hypothetical protein
VSYHQYEIRRRITSSRDGGVNVSNDARMIRIIADWGSTDTEVRVWFTNRETARAVGSALLASARAGTQVADQRWAGDDDTVVQVTVEPAVPILHIGDDSWPLSAEDAIHLGQWLITWADQARKVEDSSSPRLIAE